MSEVNPLFRNFEKDGTVTGYGISSPGRLYEQMLALRNGTLSATDLEAAHHPLTIGFYTTLVLEAAEKSLAEGKKLSSGATRGASVDLRQLIVRHWVRTGESIWVWLERAIAVAVAVAGQNKTYPVLLARVVHAPWAALLAILRSLTHRAMFEPDPLSTLRSAAAIAKPRKGCWPGRNTTCFSGSPARANPSRLPT